MQYTQLGRTGLKVSRLCLGTMNFGPETSEADSFTIMAQSFNIIASGNGKPPYRYYRSHKLELGTLQRLWKGVYLESGAYISPTGQNSLVERGAVASIWIDF